MSKEYAKDLSLLYYDFNNSTARLVSKQKKLSDFVIQEEAEELAKPENENVGKDNESGQKSKFNSPDKKEQISSPTIDGPRKPNMFK